MGRNSRYAPYPIYDLRSGVQLDRQPWLLPSSAFQVARNVYFYQGRAFKRRGYSKFATGTGGSGVNVLASPPVMGLFEYYTTAGSNALLAFDTDFMYQYNPVDNDWVGKGGYPSTPDWTGDADNYFWTEIWKDLLFICNNKDYIKYWDGSTLTNLRPDCDPGGTTNYLDTCLLLINHKDRLIALNTQESTDGRKPHRARCSNVGSYTTWDDDIYVDADTVDWIVGAAKVRGELMVFFERSVWWLKYTGDPSAPFGWEQIAETEGAYATNSVVNFESEAIALGPTSFISCDGLQVNPIDEKVPDLVLEMNPNKTYRGYGFVADEMREYLCGYPSLGSEYNDKCLVLNYVDNAFSLHDLPFHVAGYYTQGEDWTFDDISVSMDEMTWAFDEKTLVAGYPLTLIGKTNGYVYQLFTGDSDDGAAINSQLRTKRLIPFDNGIAKLGFIDLIGQSGSQVSVTVRCYKDWQDTPYFSQTVSLYKVGQGKIRARLRVGEKGEAHTIEIVDNSTGNPWVIDAIVPWFKYAGSL